MAMKARYTTINGQIVSQNVGGVIHDYLPDPLGHTVALIADDETITHIFDYWPYGQLATLDDLATPFRYGGTYGYYSDTFGSTRMYVRARQLQGGYGRWMTVDPLWPLHSAYAYANVSPVVSKDPSGRWSWHLSPHTAKKPVRQDIYDAIPWEHYADFLSYLECLNDGDFCPPMKRGDPNAVNIGTQIRDWSTNYDHGHPSFGFALDDDTSEDCSPKGGKQRCAWTDRGSAPPRTIHLCVPRVWNTKQCGPLRCVIMHELIHAAGLPSGGSYEPAYACVDKLTGCAGFSAAHPH